MAGSHSVEGPHRHKVAKALVSNVFWHSTRGLLTAHWGKSYMLWAEVAGAADDEPLEASGVGGCN